MPHGRQVEWRNLMGSTSFCCSHSVCYNQMTTSAATHPSRPRADQCPTSEPALAERRTVAHAKFGPTTGALHPVWIQIGTMPSIELNDLHTSIPARLLHHFG